MNNRIAALRKANGLTQLQLANLLHISPSAEGMYEQGRRTPSLDILIAMSLIFHVSLDYLIKGTMIDEEHIPHGTQIIIPRSCYTCCCMRCQRAVTRVDSFGNDCERIF